MVLWFLLNLWRLLISSNCIHTLQTTKWRILEQFVIKNNKYSLEKQASLKLRLAVTMPTAFVRSCTDMRRIPYHFFFLLIQLTLKNMWILNLQEMNQKNISRSLNMLFNNNSHG
jgi:hypothetical protein